jgi:glycosyltransferase involved in cell wall biosynthesis
MQSAFISSEVGINNTANVKTKFKRLAIITDCVHFYNNKGNVVTENHIFCRQMQTLAASFEQTIVCCPFDNYSKENVTSIYSDTSVRFIPLPDVGGNSFKHKIQILFTIPVWLKAFKKVYKQSDIIYQRFPNNLNIPGFFYFWFKRAKVFATYTGTWKNYPGEPVTYKFQKWLLKNFFRGPVAAYIRQPGINKKVFKSFSPSYTKQEWNEEIKQVEERVQRLQSGKFFMPVFITVGALVPGKNQQYILETFKKLRQEGFKCKLYIVGNGPLKNSYLHFIEENGMQDYIYLVGSKTHTELRGLYRKADFVIQATLVEGFGKVPIEGFFHGVIPILNNINLAREMTGDEQRGFLFSANDINNLADLLKGLYNKKDLLPHMIQNGREYARSQTLENWSSGLLHSINTYFD